MGLDLSLGSEGGRQFQSHRKGERCRSWTRKRLRTHGMLKDLSSLRLDVGVIKHAKSEERTAKVRYNPKATVFTWENASNWLGSWSVSELTIGP